MRIFDVKTYVEAKTFIKDKKLYTLMIDDFKKNKNLYEKSLIAVDPIIFTISDKKLKIFLKKREKDPFKGKYELPGGLLLHDETAEQTMERKLKELLGDFKIFFMQFQSFTKPNRDPRERIISIGFMALVNEESIEIKDSWFDVEKLPDLAFDHKEIITLAKNHLCQHLNLMVAKQFLPEYFPLNKLQEVHEVVGKRKYDNRNFRKKMIQSGCVEETDQIQKGCSHRPSKLYKFKAEVHEISCK